MRQPSATDAASGRRPSLRGLSIVGIFFLALLVAESQVLPRIESSADPTLAAYPLWSWPAYLPPLPTGPPALSVFLGLGLLAGLAAFYAVGLGVAGVGVPSTRSLVLVLLITTILTLTMTLAVPTRGEDLFYYAFQGRMIARSHVNPYVLPPRSLSDDAWFPYVSPVWRDLTTGYGPVWLVISSGVDQIADRGGALADFVRTILVFRGLFAASTLVNTLLIWLILGHLTAGRRLTGTVAYAWNPAVLLIGIDHNDTTMLAFALGGLFLHLRGRRTFAVGALTLSALIKYYTLPLLFGYLLWQTRTGPRRTGQYAAGAGAIAITAVAMAPFEPLVALAHLPSYLTESGRLDHVEQVPINVLILLVIVGVTRVVTVKASADVRPTMETAALALFAYLTFLSRDWFPWYLESAVGLGALLGGVWLDLAATAGVTWMLGSHRGTAYLAGVARSAFGLDPPTTLTLALFAPTVLIAALLALWRWRQWSPRILIPGGLALLVAVTAAAEAPLVAHWQGTPPEADLGGGRPPGPVVLGTTLEWEDWSWGTTVDQIGTPPGPDGVRSVCVSFHTASATFYAHHPGLSTRGREALTFDVGPANRVVPSLTLALRGSAGQPLATVPIAGYVASAQVVDGWRRVRVPLAALDSTNTTITGVTLSGSPASIGKVTCLQDLAFR